MIVIEESKADEIVRAIRNICLEEMTGDVLYRNTSNMLWNECENPTGFMKYLCSSGTRLVI
jgi:hypothetical protein